MSEKQLDPFVLPFPEYEEGKLNSIVLVIKEEAIFEKTPGSEEPIEKKRTKENADNFLVMVNGLSKTCGFNIDAAGTREQMAVRLYKKDGRKLLTEEQVIEYAKSIYKDYTENSNFPQKPTLTTLKEWRKSKGDDYEEHF